MCQEGDASLSSKGRLGRNGAGRGRMKLLVGLCDCWALHVILTPLITGGDLHYHLTQHGVFSEPEVRFYAAELILGLEHLHSLNIVYRDLKVGGENS